VSLFGAAQVIATGLALPEITVIVEFNMEIGDLTSHPVRVFNFHSVCLWPQASYLFSWEILTIFLSTLFLGYGM
jgi:hypothetical protein